jgi:dCMP deaminase
MVDLLTYDRTMMQVAKTIATMSKAERKKVGCVIERAGNILAFGFNGTPTGFPNTCEGEDGETLPEVMHAEHNAIAKVARSTMSCDGAVMYITLSPCFQCAKQIIQAGIECVVYEEEYHNTEGLELLRQAGVLVLDIGKVVGNAYEV